MNKIFGFVVLLIGGYITGAFGNLSNLWFYFSIFILLSGFFLLLLGFYSKKGWFEERDTEEKLILLIFGCLLGYALGLLKIIKLNMAYLLLFAVIFFFGFSLYILLRDTIRYRKFLSKNKRHFYNHPLFLLAIIILIVFVIAIIISVIR